MKASWIEPGETEPVPLIVVETTGGRWIVTLPDGKQVAVRNPERIGYGAYLVCPKPGQSEGDDETDILGRDAHRHPDGIICLPVWLDSGVTMKDLAEAFRPKTVCPWPPDKPPTGTLWLETA